MCLKVLTAHAINEGAERRAGGVVSFGRLLYRCTVRRGLASSQA